MIFTTQIERKVHYILYQLLKNKIHRMFPKNISNGIIVLFLLQTLQIYFNNLTAKH